VDALTTGIDARVRRANVVTGLLSISTGIVIIAWPGPGVLAVAILFGAWLIVSGTLAITGAFAARRLLPDWWLLLTLGLLEIPLGVLALAAPGATLAALITVTGIWAVAIGVMRIVTAFELKRLPKDVDEAFAAWGNGAVRRDGAPQAQVPVGQSGPIAQPIMSTAGSAPGAVADRARASRGCSLGVVCVAARGPVGILPKQRRPAFSFGRFVPPS
jgi:hypothetical protein